MYMLFERYKELLTITKQVESNNAKMDIYNGPRAELAANLAARYLKYWMNPIEAIMKNRIDTICEKKLNPESKI